MKDNDRGYIVHGISLDGATWPPDDAEALAGETYESLRDRLYRQGEPKPEPKPTWQERRLAENRAGEDAWQELVERLGREPTEDEYRFAVERKLKAAR